jgi:uncharacterized protein YhbP (UPF0306 family)
MTSNEIAIRARHIIDGNRYVSLATTDGGNAWIAPLAYAVEPGYALVYYSALASRHQQHISQNPIVAGAIFDSTAASDDVDGLQFTARVSEVIPEELPSVMAHYFSHSFPDPVIRRRWERPITDFMGTQPQRFYRIALLDVFVIDLTETKIDRRVSVDRDALLRA